MEYSQNHVVIKMAAVVVLTFVTFDTIIFTSKFQLEWVLFNWIHIVRLDLAVFCDSHGCYFVSIQHDGVL
jgi:hypothetical protein